MKILTFDTETTGLLDYKASFDAPTQPNLVQLGVLLEDQSSGYISKLDVIIFPQDWHIGEEVAKIHGISHEKALDMGVSLDNALHMFRDLAATADRVVAHNMDFDKRVMQKAFSQTNVPVIPWERLNLRCTKLLSSPILKLPKNGGTGYKFPSLSECMAYFFKEKIVDAHTALADADAARRVYNAMLKGDMIPIDRT